MNNKVATLKRCMVIVNVEDYYIKSMPWVSLIYDVNFGELNSYNLNKSVFATLTFSPALLQAISMFSSLSNSLKSTFTFSVCLISIIDTYFLYLKFCFKSFDNNKITSHWVLKVFNFT